MVRALLANTIVWAIDRRGRLCCSDTKTRQWAYVPDAPDQPTVLAHWKEHNRVIVGVAGGTVHVYDGESKTLLNEGHATSDAAITALCVWEDHNALAVGTSLGNLIRLELSSLDLVAELDVEKGHSSAITSIVQVDSWLFSGGADSLMYVWDLESNTCHEKIHMSSQPITCLLYVAKYLWMGLQDGTVQVLDVFGEDCGEIGVIRKTRVHNGPVKCFLQVGEKELWSAPLHYSNSLQYGGPSNGQMFLNNREVTEVNDYIAVWNLETCDFARQSIPAPEDGVLGILIRQHFVHEEFQVSVFDSKLIPTDFNVKAPPTSKPIWTPPNYSSVLEAVTESEVNRLKERYRQLRENCSCHYSQALNGFSNGNPANIDNRNGNEISGDTEMDLTLLDPNAKRTPSERAYCNLVQSLNTARNKLVTALGDETRGNTNMVHSSGVIEASENILAAIGLVTQLEPSKLMNQGLLNNAFKAFESASPNGTMNSYSNFTSTPRNRPISLQDFNSIMLQRDDLQNELELVKQDAAASTSQYEDLIQGYRQRIGKLEESLEKAAVDGQECEIYKKRTVELEVLLKRQIDEVSQKVRSMEPMLTDHISQAYDHMTGDLEQLQALRDAKADLESQLGIKLGRIREIEQECDDQRTYIHRLTTDLRELKHEAEELKHDQDGMEKTISELRVACTIHDRELEFTRSANSKLREAVEDIQAELELTKASVQHSQASETELRRQLRLLEAEEKSLKTQLKLAVDEGRNRERTLLKEQSTLSELTSKLEAAEKSLASTRREVAKSTRSSDSMSNENKKLKKQVAEMGAKLNNKVQQLTGIVEERDALIMDRNALQIQLDDVQEANAGSCSVCTNSDDQDDGGQPSTSSPTKPSKRPQHSIVTAGWEIKGSRDDKELREALEAAAESTRCTQQVVKELASTAKAYKRAAAYHSQSQTAIYAILKRMRQLSKRKSVTGAHISPIVEALLKVLYIDASNDDGDDSAGATNTSTAAKT